MLKISNYNFENQENLYIIKIIKLKNKEKVPSI